MNADIKGSLSQINKSWRAFVFEGKSMNKEWVRRCLEYGIMKGYESTDQIPEEAIKILKYHEFTEITIIKKQTELFKIN